MGDGWIDFGEGGVVELGLPGTPCPDRRAMAPPPPVEELVADLEAYWQGGPLPAADDDMIDRAGSTDLTRRIYAVVSAIPRGETMTYADVAAAVGRPDAPRAVGAAIARNPFAPVIPCHRVVGSDGTLRGYGGGLDMKQYLLEMESADG
jgi:methylated-DNA-[protein]-cysteine S-methyltransferase